jgi:hypothetical protein
MGLHLHQVPQADMLECKLEILLLVPYSTIKSCMFEYVAPEGSVQQRTSKSHIFVAFVERLIYMNFGLVDLKG